LLKVVFPLLCFFFQCCRRRLFGMKPTNQPTNRMQYQFLNNKVVQLCIVNFFVRLYWQVALSEREVYCQRL